MSNASEISYYELSIEFTNRYEKEEFVFDASVNVVSPDGGKLAEDGVPVTGLNLAPVLEELKDSYDPGDTTRGDLRLKLSALNKKLGEENALSGELGQALYKHLIADNSMINGYANMLYGMVLPSSDPGNTPEKRARIRIKTNLEKFSDVASLPWELLYGTLPPKEGFLTLKNNVSLVRHVTMKGRPVEKPNLKDPSILIAIANPEDTTELMTEEEKGKIVALFPAERIKVLPVATHKELKMELRRGYDIFHYIGHAEFAEGEGNLLLHGGDDPSKSEALSGSSLSDMLLGSNRKTQFVFLNGCETAVYEDKNGDNPYTGLATALVDRGVPAVLAMQRKVKDRKAITFAEMFYNYLNGGDDLEQSVYNARGMIDEETDWAIPVLFIRS